MQLVAMAGARSTKAGASSISLISGTIPTPTERAPASSSTRRLPIGGDAGVIVCEEHSHQEMESRKLAAPERGEPDYRGYPAWPELEMPR
jgi:hypothetical protein